MTKLDSSGEVERRRDILAVQFSAELACAISASLWIAGLAEIVSTNIFMIRFGRRVTLCGAVDL
jgi:hypothetical protein